MARKLTLLLMVATLGASAHCLAQSSQVEGSSTTTGSAQAGREGASANAANASSAAATAKPATAGASGNSEMHATLDKPVDARKAKPGDKVTATNDSNSKTSDGKSVPRGSKLVGRVTRAEPKGTAKGGADSALGITFDKAVLKDGSEIPLSLGIQAIGSAEATASAARNDVGYAGAGTGGASPRHGGGLLSGAGGSLSGVTGTVGGVAATGTAGLSGSVSRSAGAVGGMDATGSLMSGSRGVFGVEGYSLSSSAESAMQGSVIHSTTRSVRLDGGTKLLLSSSAGPAENSATAANKPATAETTTPAKRDKQ